MNEKEFDELYAKLGDLIMRADRGALGISAFLSPKELHYAQKFLQREGQPYLSFGGYEDAERKRIYILPEYMEMLTRADRFGDFDVQSDIEVLQINTSGYEKLTHRDFMGAILGLGIERSVIGDILMLDNSSALVFCSGTISDFLQNELSYVGRDKVRVEKTTLPTNFEFKRQYAAISDTVASPRLDCVVAALCSLSREKAKELVISGLAELDYETEERPDREVRNQNILSLRGYGKFCIVSIDTLTKKGRYRLIGERFI